MELYNAVSKISVDYKAGIYKEAEKNDITISEMNKRIFEAGLTSFGIGRINSMIPDDFEFDVISNVTPKVTGSRSKIENGWVRISRYITKSHSGIKYDLGFHNDDINSISRNSQVYLMFSTKQKTIMFAAPLINSGIISENDPRVKRYSIACHHKDDKKSMRIQASGNICKMFDNIFGSTFKSCFLQLEFNESFGCYMIRNTVEENSK